ncbi:MAG: Type 1 glutamine amidotransferase-like domain-containing protein [Thermotogae bacterium]|nr:Type 1 glutamine amidotransferase-like domain-containing protein [Thermotogota bacterium]
MAKLYFLGGVDIKMGEDKRIDERALADAGKDPIVLVFPWTAWFTTGRKNKNRKIIRDYFKDTGAKKIIFAELTDSLKGIKKKIKSADLIYLPGGEPKLLIRRLRRRGIDLLLKKYTGIIVGNSAGAVALCKEYAVIKGQDGRLKTTLEPGLGLVDFTISVHYGSPIKWPGGNSPDKEHKRLSKKIRIYAIPERCALVYDGKDLKTIGKVYVFDKGKKIKF